MLSNVHFFSLQLSSDSLFTSQDYRKGRCIQYVPLHTMCTIQLRTSVRTPTQALSKSRNPLCSFTTRVQNSHTACHDGLERVTQSKSSEGFHIDDLPMLLFFLKMCVCVSAINCWKIKRRSFCMGKFFTCSQNLILDEMETFKPMGPMGPFMASEDLNTSHLETWKWWLHFYSMRTHKKHATKTGRAHRDSFWMDMWPLMSRYQTCSRRDEVQRRGEEVRKGRNINSVVAISNKYL